MKRYKLHLSTAGWLFALLTLAMTQVQAAPRDVVIGWNQTLQQTVAGPPFAQVRIYAMMHIAMADAVVAIEGRFQPYHVAVSAPAGASSSAAAAQAAHDVLVGLIPASKATYDAALQANLASIDPASRSSGVQVGKKVAAQVLSWRRNDGAATANPQPPTLALSVLPGIWRPTASGPAQYSEWGTADPFGLLTPTQFLPAPPPQLESEEYAEAFNEVKSKGRATGANRTPAQTRFAQLFASSGPYANATNPLRLWQNVAIQMSQKRGLSLLSTARLFALVSASIHDSLQTAHVSKFVYRLWRPQTAIDQAGLDDNPDTAAEALWPPLVVTPPYPSHASNMTCIGAGASRMLANVLNGDAASFTATWYTAASPPAVVHSQPYGTFSALARDEANSRVWGGIHFRFELEAALQSCTQVADYIFDHYMRNQN